MSALAIDLLRKVSDAGGTVRLEGDMLRLSAPEPLPDELRTRLHQHKAEIVALLAAAEPANDAAPVAQSVGTAADVFGCDRRAPWHRLDRTGLVLLIGRHEIVELSADDATLRGSTGSVLRYRRRPPARPPVALLWELLISAPTTGPPIRGPTPPPSEERMAATYLAGPRRHPDHDHS